MAQTIIVDKDDNIIGTKPRNEVTSSDIYRVSSLWLTNSKGDILLARRAFTKSHSPGMWGPAVAGTNEEGETYESNIVKEMFEELGLKDIPITKGPKHFVQREWTYFGQRFFATVDRDIKDFVIAKDEIAEIAWFSVEHLKKELAAHPLQFTASIGMSIK